MSVLVNMSTDLFHSGAVPKIVHAYLTIFQHFLQNFVYNIMETMCFKSVKSVTLCNASSSQRLHGKVLN
jgi:hypothetical protein